MLLRAKSRMRSRKAACCSDSSKSIAVPVIMARTHINDASGGLGYEAEFSEASALSSGRSGTARPEGALVGTTAQEAAGSPANRLDAPPGHDRVEEPVRPGRFEVFRRPAN